MPDNAKYVGRPTKYGNPLKLVSGEIYIDASYRRKVLDPWVHVCPGDIHTLMELYRSILYSYFEKMDEAQENIKDFSYWHGKFLEIDFFEDLEGKDLACFCSLSSPCHADLLIEMIS